MTIRNSSRRSSAAQRQRVLQRLRQGPATTIQLRREEDTLMPAARIHELRHRYGLEIDTFRVRRPTDGGRMHSVAQYVLRREGSSLATMENADEPAKGGSHVER